MQTFGIKIRLISLNSSKMANVQSSALTLGTYDVFRILMNACDCEQNPFFLLPTKSSMLAEIPKINIFIKPPTLPFYIILFL